MRLLVKHRSAMAPVVLQTDVHCLGCAKRIRKCIKNMLGVEGVWASLDMGVVVVAGTADAEVLRWRIQQRTRRPVTIVSDGAEAEDHLNHHYYGMPPGRPGYYGWGTTSSSRPRRYMFLDDEYPGEGCCSVQ